MYLYTIISNILGSFYYNLLHVIKISKKQMLIDSVTVAQNFPENTFLMPIPFN